MTEQLVGYVRVSWLDQNADHQLDGVAVDRTFTAKKFRYSSASRPRDRISL